VQETKPRLIGSGGALLSSPLLQQIIVDTIGAPLYPSHEREASARGVALLALEAMGILPDVGKGTLSLATPVLPDLKRGEIYREAAKRQMELYKALLGDVEE